VARRVADFGKRPTAGQGMADERVPAVVNGQHPKPLQSQRLARRAKTPPQIIATLNKLVNEALASAEFKARFVDLGLEPYATSPAEFGKFTVDYTEKWGNVIRAANIKAE